MNKKRIIPTGILLDFSLVKEKINPQQLIMSFITMSQIIKAMVILRLSGTT